MPEPNEMERKTDHLESFNVSIQTDILFFYFLLKQQKTQWRREEERKGEIEREIANAR